MKETTLTFIGHGTCYGIDKEMIKTVLRPLIADKGIDTFYFQAVWATSIGSARERFTN